MARPQARLPPALHPLAYCYFESGCPVCRAIAKFVRRSVGLRACSGVFCYDWLRAPMKMIRYGLHFSILSVAIAIFWLARNVDLPTQIINFRVVHLGLMGVLYATAIVTSLRDLKAARPVVILFFIALVTTWSIATPILGLWASIAWVPLFKSPHPNLGTIFILLTGSVIGASGCWILVRLFWLKFLRRADWLKTAALCAIGTSLAFTVSKLTLSSPKLSVYAADLVELVLTAAWWSAFSLSLYWSETRAYARRSAEVPPDAQG